MSERANDPEGRAVVELRGKLMGRGSTVDPIGRVSTWTYFKVRRASSTWKTPRSLSSLLLLTQSHRFVFPSSDIGSSPWSKPRSVIAVLVLVTSPHRKTQVLYLDVTALPT